MRMADTLRKPRKSTNLTLDADLADEAKTLGISLSRAAEQGIAAAVKAEKERRWCEENAEAIAASNRYVEEHGLPLEKLRLFRIG